MAPWQAMRARLLMLSLAITLLLQAQGAIATEILPSAWQELSLLRAEKSQRQAAASTLDSALWLRLRAASDPRVVAAVSAFRTLLATLRADGIRVAVALHLERDESPDAPRPGHAVLLLVTAVNRFGRQPPR